MGLLQLDKNKSIWGAEEMSEPKKYTLEEARATLPLVRSIVRDIREVWQKYVEDKTRSDLFFGLRKIEDCSKEELHYLEVLESTLNEFYDELHALGVELKAPDTGLVDFRSDYNGKEVYLCWRYGEPDILYWHAFEDGYSGRRLIEQEEVAVRKISIESSMESEWNSE